MEIRPQNKVVLIYRGNRGIFLNLFENMEENFEKKNEYFEKKQEKEEEERKRGARAIINKTIKWIIILFIVGGGVFWLYKYNTKPAASKPGEFFKEQSREHIAVGAAHPDYSSNPPTSGQHYERPAQTGIYDKELPDEQLIHNLEHSHIWISYWPDLSNDQIEKLAKIASDYGSRVIMTPRAKNDLPIVLAAWQYLLKLDNIDEARISDFISAHRNVAGPERNIPDAGFKDFRKK